MDRISEAAITQVLSSKHFAPGASAGLFVGTRFFYDGKIKSKEIAEVKYAADDAVDLAFAFTYTLDLIRPTNVVLALSGDPRKKKTKARLKVLQEDKAEIVSADYVELWRQIIRTRDRAEELGYLIVSFSTHGYAQNGDRLVCRDSLLPKLNETGLDIPSVIDALSDSKAMRRLVLFDACRERIREDQDERSLTDTRNAMQKSFHKTIDRAKGMAILSSTTYGGYSYDDKELCNGVFTGRLIKGLTEVLPTGESPYVTPQSLAEYLDEQVKSWVAANRPEHKKLSRGISYQVESVDSGKMPLALSSRALNKTEEEKRRLEEYIEGVKLLIDFESFTGKISQEIASVLKANRLEDLSDLTERLDLLPAEPGTVQVEDFLRWWEAQGRRQYGLQVKNGKLVSWLNVRLQDARNSQTTSRKQDSADSKRKHRSEEYIGALAGILIAIEMIANSHSEALELRSDISSRIAGTLFSWLSFPLSWVLYGVGLAGITTLIMAVTVLVGALAQSSIAFGAAFIVGAGAHRAARRSRLFGVKVSLFSFLGTGLLAALASGVISLLDVNEKGYPVLTMGSFHPTELTFIVIAGAFSGMVLSWILECVLQKYVYRDRPSTDGSAGS